MAFNSFYKSGNFNGGPNSGNPNPFGPPQQGGMQAGPGDVKPAFEPRQDGPPMTAPGPNAPGYGGLPTAPQFNGPASPGRGTPAQGQQGMNPMSGYNQYASRMAARGTNPIANAPSWAPQNPLRAKRRPTLPQFAPQPFTDPQPDPNGGSIYDPPNNPGM